MCDAGPTLPHGVGSGNGAGCPTARRKLDAAIRQVEIRRRSRDPFRVSFVEMADKEWKDPVTEAYKRDVDRTLLEKNLRLTPEERILAAMELQRLAEEVRRAGREAQRPR